MPFVLIRWCPRWLSLGGSTTLSTSLKWRRYCYVQRAYLNGFAKNNKVYVLQKRTKTILKNQDTKNVCVIGNHNSITLENLLADNIEKDWEKHLSDIIENKISSDTFSYMAYYSAIQYLRTYFFYLIREVLPPHFPGGSSTANRGPRTTAQSGA
jgi:Protein of unknown function (DUF4238)